MLVVVHAAGVIAREVDEDVHLVPGIHVGPHEPVEQSLPRESEQLPCDQDRHSLATLVAIGSLLLPSLVAGRRRRPSLACVLTCVFTPLGRVDHGFTGRNVGGGDG